MIKQGYKKVDYPEKADILFVNTCSIREHAEDKVHSLLGRYNLLKRNNPSLIIGVLGCMAQSLKHDILEDDEPMKRMDYNGVTYYLSRESLGHCRDWEDDPNYDDSWSKLVSWEFLDETEKKFISVERWGEYEIEAAKGMYIEEFEISNIIPVSN